MKKPRTRRSVDEARLRAECRSLRHASVYADLAALDDPEIFNLLRRTRDALGDLELLVFSHDDSGARFLVTFAGDAAVRDGAKLAETILRTKPDEELFGALSQFLDDLSREWTRRGHASTHE